MAAARRLEQRLEQIHAIASDPTADGAAAVLRDALRSKSGILIAAAAPVVAQAELEPLVAELPDAFARMLERPVERDPQCRGKVAIARALHQLSRWEEGVFARGVRHVQREATPSGYEDTAAELRGVCGIVFAQFGRGDALEVLAELLADPERNARAGAAQGLGDSGRPDAGPLLRFKALVGDSEPIVMSACLSSLLAIEGDGALEFVARFLDGAEETAELAALALGESRRAAAFPILRTFCDDSTASMREQVGYLALTLLRLDAATDHLIDVIRGDDAREAIAAARALATFRDDPALADRALEAAAANPDASVAAEARAAFRRA
jgi:hypothetical protein